MEKKMDKYVKRIFAVWEKLKKEYGIDQSIPLVIAPPDDFPAYKAHLLNILFNINHFKPAEFRDGDGAHATTVTRIIPDDNNVCHVFCAGVIMNMVTVYRIVKNNAENEMIRFIEVLLRHEIGHIISVAVMHEGITAKESNMIDADIEQMTKAMIANSNNSAVTFEEYVKLPLEFHANKCAHVNDSELIKLSYKFEALD